jgi:hypothetical protein
MRRRRKGSQMKLQLASNPGRQALGEGERTSVEALLAQLLQIVLAAERADQGAQGNE